MRAANVAGRVLRACMPGTVPSALLLLALLAATDALRGGVSADSPPDLRGRRGIYTGGGGRGAMRMIPQLRGGDGSKENGVDNPAPDGEAARAPPAQKASSGAPPA